jgi:hypothetical protein
MFIIQPDDEDPERNEWHEEQYHVLYLVSEVAMKIIGKGTNNHLSKPRGSIRENLTRCLQKYVLLGYERDRKYLNFKTNNRVLQAILRVNIFDFH